MSLQFFTSARVLAQAEPGQANAAIDNEVIIVPRGTPGVATNVAADRITVRFIEGGGGAVFLADTDETSGGYKRYFLATQVEGSERLQMVKDVPGHIVLIEGVRYEVEVGYAVFLQCETNQLQEMIDKREVLGWEK